MNDSTVVSNEAEFERWLIAALQYERRRLLEAGQHDNDRRSSTVSCADSETSPEIASTSYFAC